LVLDLLVFVDFVSVVVCVCGFSSITSLAFTSTLFEGEPEMLIELILTSAADVHFAANFPDPVEIALKLNLILDIGFEPPELSK